LVSLFAEIVAHIYGHFHEPRLERTAPVEPVKKPEGSKEYFLRRVLSVLRPAEQPPRQSENPPFIPDNDPFKRGYIACDCAFYQNPNFFRIRVKAGHPQRCRT
jgi:hypothetical protein